MHASLLGFRVLGCRRLDGEGSGTTSRAWFLLDALLRALYGDRTSCSSLIIYGSCQNYGPFLGALNNRCRIIIGTQKGANNDTYVSSDLPIYLSKYRSMYL